MKKVKSGSIISITICAVFAAFSACLSQISLQIGAVPINFAHVSIFIAAGLLGAKLGSISQAIFVALGAFGVPVFSGFKGGLAHVAGPSGGFIVGYVLCAFVTGILITRFGKNIPLLMLCMYGGWVATYIPGLLWFMFNMKVGLTEAAAACFLPFIPGDFIKTLIAALLVYKLRPIVRGRYLQ